MREGGRGGGARPGAGEGAQDCGLLLYPGVRRAGLQPARARTPRPGAAPRRRRLLPNQGVRGGRHPRHGVHPHPPRRVRQPHQRLPHRRAVEGVPLCRLRRHGRSHRHARRRHPRHRLLHAGALQEGQHGRRRRGRGEAERRHEAAAQPPPPHRQRRRRGARGTRARAHPRDARPRARLVGARRGCRRGRQGDNSPASCHLSGSRARDRGALGDHWHLPRRVPESGCDQAAGGRPQLPPNVRGHGSRWLHRAGEVQGEINRDDDPLLLPDDADGYRRWRGHLVGVQREQPNGAGGGGHPQLRRGGDPRLHGPRRPPRRGLHEPQGAEQREASAWDQPCHARWRRPHVHARQMGLG